MSDFAKMVSKENEKVGKAQWTTDSPIERNIIKQLKYIDKADLNICTMLSFVPAEMWEETYGSGPAHLFDANRLIPITNFLMGVRPSTKNKRLQIQMMWKFDQKLQETGESSEEGLIPTNDSDTDVEHPINTEEERQGGGYELTTPVDTEDEDSENEEYDDNDLINISRRTISVRLDRDLHKSTQDQESTGIEISDVEDEEEATVVPVENNTNRSPNDDYTEFVDDISPGGDVYDLIRPVTYKPYASTAKKPEDRPQSMWDVLKTVRATPIFKKPPRIPETSIFDDFPTGGRMENPS